MLCGWKREK
ncbi:hypothetical protein Ahy_B01g053948 isoform C [Arachis hypogaea]|uniref:Uncharacterized protein n=1 Tax=Arachis hypogaea TaxID=3818 RepID=A0A445ASY6_ARAHY|nr:hypothetical protein Ahy_B01g053948 isoform C [Arachis hypogaea]